MTKTIYVDEIKSRSGSDIAITSPITMSDTTQSTSKDTGSYVCEGGVLVKKDLYCGGLATQNGKYFHVDKGGTTQPISNGAEDTVTFNTVIFDTDSAFDDANDRFQPNTFGKWLIVAQTGYSGLSTTERHILALYDDSGTKLVHASGGVEGQTVTFAHVMEFDGVTVGKKYCYLTSYHTSTGSESVYGDSRLTYFQAYFLG